MVSLGLARVSCGNTRSVLAVWRPMQPRFVLALLGSPVPSLHHLPSMLGTGKTLLARASAAECGAAFISVTPSTLASKWLGDGVRYVRAPICAAARVELHLAGRKLQYAGSLN